MNRLLVLDIEAVAIDGVGDFLEPVSAPGNYKDPEKIAAVIAEKRAELVARAALDPDLAAIRALGFQEGTETHVWLFKNDTEERQGLSDFCGVFSDHRFITFNGFGYDLPLLMRRSLYLGVKCPTLNLDRYRSPHIDLMQKLSFNGAIKAHSLRFYAKRLGIPVEDEVSGADIGRLVSEGQWDKVKAHCASDVQLTAAVARRLGYLPTSTRQEVSEVA